MSHGARVIVLLLGIAYTPASAQDTRALTSPNPLGRAGAFRPQETSSEASRGVLSLSATFGADAKPVQSGVKWRVFAEHAEGDQAHRLIAESADAAPAIALPDGAYIIHAAYGLTGVTRRVVINGRPVSERVALGAGALTIMGVLGDSTIPAARLRIAIYVPERGNAEAKLVVANARAGDVIRLPEGNYHIVSTYLDATVAGSRGAESNATNSVVAGDVRVQPGKVTETTLRHRAAVETLKLVNAPNGEAFANTSFTILTPGGDVIRELIGAFPSLALAEGEYALIARHAGKTYQSTFKVQSAIDRDVEIVAQ